MEINNYGATDALEFKGEMDRVGAKTWAEHYKGDKHYLRMTLEVQEYMLDNLDAFQHKLLTYIFYKSFKGMASSSMWIKETNIEIGENIKMDKNVVKKHLIKFEDAGIIKRYKRHQRDKQHIVVMPFENWKVIE